MSTTSSYVVNDVMTIQANAATDVGIRVSVNSSGKATIAGITVTGIGITTDGAAADGYVGVRLWSAPTHVGQCSEAIAVGDTVYTAANGRFSKTSGGGALQMGIALTATSNAGELFTFAQSRT
jgi:hypothetical protein